jgi:hypothetical protein
MVEYDIVDAYRYDVHWYRRALEEIAQAVGVPLVMDQSDLPLGHPRRAPQPPPKGNAHLLEGILVALGRPEGSGWHFDPDKLEGR